MRAQVLGGRASRATHPRVLNGFLRLLGRLMDEDPTDEVRPLCPAAAAGVDQALADEWAADGVRVNCVNPERTATPMRTKAFGEEPEGTLLTSEAVAETSLDVLISSWTGHIVDVRREDKLTSHLHASVAAEILHEEEPADLVPPGVDPLAVQRG